jgi:D-alanine-D-alanine ligase
MMDAGKRRRNVMQIAIVYNCETGTVRGEPQDIIALQETVSTASYIHETLSSLGYQTSEISITASLNELRNSLSAYSNQDTFIFNICDGFGGKNSGSVQVIELIESLGFKHTGSTADAVAQCINKASTKECLARCSVPTPAYEIYYCAEGETSLHFPIIVKPQMEDASLGIDLRSVVCNQEELFRRVRYVIEQYDQPALVEEFIPGRELAVAVLGNGEDIETLPITENDYCNIENPLQRLLTYEAKWIVESPFYHNILIRCPAPLEPTAQRTIYQTAINAFHVLGLRDLARMDIRYHNLIPYIIDVNEIPDLFVDSGFPREANLAGYSYAQMIERILDTALRREGWR